MSALPTANLSARFIENPFVVPQPDFAGFPHRAISTMAHFGKRPSNTWTDPAARPRPYQTENDPYNVASNRLALLSFPYWRQNILRITGARPMVAHAKGTNIARLRVRKRTDRRPGNELLSCPRGRRSNRRCTARVLGDPHRRGLSNRLRD